MSALCTTHARDAVQSSVIRVMPASHLTGSNEKMRPQSKPKVGRGTLMRRTESYGTDLLMHSNVDRSHGPVLRSLRNKHEGQTGS